MVIISKAKTWPDALNLLGVEMRNWNGMTSATRGGQRRLLAEKGRPGIVVIPARGCLDNSNSLATLCGMGGSVDKPRHDLVDVLIRHTEI